MTNYSPDELLYDFTQIDEKIYYRCLSDKTELELLHYDREGQQCSLLIPIGPDLDKTADWKEYYDSAYWHVVSGNPLSLMPSIICRECNLHGYITFDNWSSTSYVATTRPGDSRPRLVENPTPILEHLFTTMSKVVGHAVSLAR